MMKELERSVTELEVELLKDEDLTTSEIEEILVNFILHRIEKNPKYEEYKKNAPRTMELIEKYWIH